MMFSVNKEVLWNNVRLKGEKWSLSWRGKNIRPPNKNI